MKKSLTAALCLLGAVLSVSGSASAGNTFEGKGTIEQTVLVDEKDIKITADSLEYGSYQAKLNLLIENNTAEDLTFISGSIGYSCNAVNGYTISSIYVNEDVTAGSKLNCDASFSYDELQACGITDIAEIEIGFEVQDSDDNDYLETGPIRIETSSAASYDVSADSYQEALQDGSFENISDSTIEAVQAGSFYSSNGVELISAATAEKDGDKAVLMELQNTSDRVLKFGIGSFAVNNLVISPSGWDSISLNPNGRGVMAVDIGNMTDADEYRAFGLDEIAKVDFHASIRDMDGNDLVQDDSVDIVFADRETPVDETGEELYNEGGVQVIYKGTSDNSLYHYLLLTIVNSTESTIYVSDESGSTSVNGFMTDENAYGRIIEPGQAGGMKYGIAQSALEDNGIDKNEIETVSFQLNIGSGSYYNYIAQPKLTVNAG